LTHILAYQRHTVYHTAIFHLVQEGLDNHLPDAAPLQSWQHSERVQPDGAPGLMVTDGLVGAAPRWASPLLWIRHVGVGDGISAAPCRDNMGEEHAHSAVSPARLDHSSGRERFEAEVRGTIWDNGEKDAEA